MWGNMGTGRPGSGKITGHGSYSGPGSEECPGCRATKVLGRRRFIGLMGVGVAVFVTGCGTGKPGGRTLGAGEESAAAARAVTSQATPPGATTTISAATSRAVAEAPSTGIPRPRPGPPQVFYHAPELTNRIALTIDDGYCAPCAEAYARFAASTGIHITFSPNGMYQSIWNPLAGILDPLIRAGQVQIANHTYSHINLVASSDARHRARNRA